MANEFIARNGITSLGNIVVSGSITTTGTVAISGSIASASFATNASTASSADNFLTRGTLTAQTLVVQTITSSVDFVTGSTRFGSIAANTHTFTGSVLTSGSISIGTTSTTHRLNISTPSSSVSGIQITKAGVLTSFLGDGGSEYPIGVLNLYDSGSQKVQIYAGSVSYFTGGNVGIRTTTPQASLHIAGLADQNALTIGTSNSYEIFITGSDSANIYHASPNQAIYLNTNGGPLYLGPSAASTLLTISGSSIGIGTITPTGSLHLKGSNHIVGSFGSQMINIESSIDNYAGIVFSGTGGYNAAMRTEGGNTITFWTTAGTAWTERMRISGSGSVGINTISPTLNTGLTVKRPTGTGWIIDTLNSSNTRVGGFYVTGGGNGQLYLANNSGTETIVLDSLGTSYLNGGNVGIGTSTPLATLSTIGGAVQFMGDYRNHQTIIKSAGTSGTLSGALTITIPQMSDGNVDGYGGYSCEVYVAGYPGFFCHVWFSGYINGGITSSEATILRSNGGWSISQVSYGANNQGFQFTIDYPSYIIHPTARIIFNKGGSSNSNAYPANSITAVFS
jgi:hypothetical protein